MKLTEQTRSISRESGLRDRQWVVIDANERALGRVASRAASLLTGKTRPDYTPNQDTGDFVVIINAAKVRLTGSKTARARCTTATPTWPGGIRKTTAGKMLEEKPERLLEIAVQGDAAEESARASDFQQAQSLSRRRASACGAEAQKL